MSAFAAAFPTIAKDIPKGWSPIIRVARVELRLHRRGSGFERSRLGVMK
jgi:hypothetical protein